MNDRKQTVGFREITAVVKSRKIVYVTYFGRYIFVMHEICNGNIYSTVAQTTTERSLDAICCRFLRLHERRNTTIRLQSQGINNLGDVFRPAVNYSILILR